MRLNKLINELCKENNVEVVQATIDTEFLKMEEQLKEATEIADELILEELKETKRELIESKQAILTLTKELAQLNERILQLENSESVENKCVPNGKDIVDKIEELQGKPSYVFLAERLIEEWNLEKHYAGEEGNHIYDFLTNILIKNGYNEVEKLMDENDSEQLLEAMKLVYEEYSKEYIEQVRNGKKKVTCYQIYEMAYYWSIEDILYILRNGMDVIDLEHSQYAKFMGGYIDIDSDFLLWLPELVCSKHYGFNSYGDEYCNEIPEEYFNEAGLIEPEEELEAIRLVEIIRTKAALKSSCKNRFNREVIEGALRKMPIEEVRETLINYGGRTEQSVDKYLSKF